MRLARLSAVALCVASVACAQVWGFHDDNASDGGMAADAGADQTSSSSSGGSSSGSSSGSGSGSSGGSGGSSGSSSGNVCFYDKTASTFGACTFGP